MSIQSNKDQIASLLLLGYQEATVGNNKTRAIQCFQQVLEIEPHNENALVWLAYLHLKDHPFEALRIYEQILALNPDNMLARAWRPNAELRCQEVNELVAGATTVEESWQKGKRHQARKVAYIPHLGEYLLSRQLITQAQLEEGLNQYQELIDKGQKPKLGEILVRLGYITTAQLESNLAEQRQDFYFHFKD